MFALHPKRYFARQSSKWLKFDYFISIVSFGGQAIEASGTTVSFNPTILRILRIFRVLRILKALKIFRHAKNLIGILEALGQSVSLTKDIFFLFMVMLMIFSVIGVLLFGHLCVDYMLDSSSASLSRCMLLDPSLLLQRYANFQNSAYAALTLIRVSTGETWSELMLKVSTTSDRSNRAEGALVQAEALLRARKSQVNVYRRQQLLQSARDLLPGW